MLKKEKIAAYEALAAEYSELWDLMKTEEVKRNSEEYNKYSQRCREIFYEAAKLIPEKLKQAHWDEMRKLFREQVKNEPDMKKAIVNSKKIATEELAWLRVHPGYRRFFSALNSEYNPM